MSKTLPERTRSTNSAATKGAKKTFSNITLHTQVRWDDQSQYHHRWQVSSLAGDLPWCSCPLQLYGGRVFRHSAHTRTRTHAHTHTRAHTHKHKHKHAQARRYSTCIHPHTHARARTRARAGIGSSFGANSTHIHSTCMSILVWPLLLRETPQYSNGFALTEAGYHPEPAFALLKSGRPSVRPAGQYVPSHNLRAEPTKTSKTASQKASHLMSLQGKV